MLADGAPVPPSWDATSDSLAAWLARELNATRLLLIKSVDLPSGAPLNLRELAEADMVDPLFPSLAGVSGADVYFAGPTAIDTAAAVFAQGGVPGALIPHA
jgi:dihydroneopterin aldolase